MNNEIISKLKSEKNKLFEKYKVTKLGIFGSFARGEDTPIVMLIYLLNFQKLPV